MAPVAVTKTGQETQWGFGMIGVVVASVFYGITCVQTYTYYVNYRRDSWTLKLLVGVLWALGSAHTAVITYTAYFYVIIHFGAPQTVIVWSQPAHVYIISTIAWIVQIFLIVRIWRMSRGIFRYASVTLLSLVSALAFVMGFAYASRLLQIKLIAHSQQISALMDTALGSTMAEDILLTIWLSYLLTRSRTGSQQTDTLINTLIKYTVRNGLVTSTCAFFDVILRAIFPTTLAFIPFYFVLAQLYIVTSLATLNARNSLRNQGYSTDSASIKFEGFKPGIDSGCSNLDLSETLGHNRE
ncbi:hypothetical protein PILCRDRAFT_557932 [Piloderma croceum F 1598]|uniref:DUF6534 domain-containing protein n=1 Tax=Piloderma croceum (strain F 1598) TaxID=765440 RepID=A0A0C3F406_PILCF|nr:hypothetical protein PILCRDRAFT_557932 [Piloderma croceum F 1598]